MKVLFLPINYGYVVASGVYDAFREAGCELEVFDFFYEYDRLRQDRQRLRQLFLERATNYAPDLIHMQIQHTDLIDGSTVGRVKKALPNTIISNWTGDVRNYIPDTYRDVAIYSDYNLISSTGQIAQFEQSLGGRKVHFWQIGYDPKLYSPSNNTRFEYDVAFIANNNTIEGYPGRDERERAIKLLRNAFGDRFALYGAGWSPNLRSKGVLDQKRVAEIYHKSICCLSISHYNDLENYFSDRLLMCMASGRPTICYRFPGWENYFTNNCDLLISERIDDIADHVHRLKRDPDFANFVGISGARKVYAEHTYLSRIHELLNIVGLR